MPDENPLTPPRETRVLDAMVTLIDGLLDDFDVVELLTDLTERSAELLDITAAGLLLADPGGQLHLMAATSHATREVELLQLQAEEGPCLDCYTAAAPVTVPDLNAARQRWPRFAAAATAAGFASVHAVPMHAAGAALGALGLFGDAPGELNDADLLVAQSLAHVASVALLHDHRVAAATAAWHLQSALTSRVVVEQAQGYLREALGVSLGDAFRLLRAHARTHDDHLTELARRVLTDSRADRETMLAEMRLELRM